MVMVHIDGQGMVEVPYEGYDPTIERDYSDYTLGGTTSYAELLPKLQAYPGFVDYYQWGYEGPGAAIGQPIPETPAPAPSEWPGGGLVVNPNAETISGIGIYDAAGPPVAPLYDDFQQQGPVATGGGAIFGALAALAGLAVAAGLLSKK